jgi:hypothetical protein
MTGLGQVSDLLASCTPETLADTFNAVISVPAFSVNSTGVCAQIVSSFAALPLGNDWSAQFIEFLFGFPSDTNALKRSALDFLYLWIRSSGPDAIELQVTVLETIATRVRILLEAEPGNAIPQLAIAQLIDRCSTFVLPDLDKPFEPVPSAAAFVATCPSLSRTSRSARIRGRLHIVASRIFPAFAPFTQAKKGLSVEVTRGDVPLLTVLQKLAGGTAGPLDFQCADQFLSKVTVVRPHGSGRLPGRVLWSFDSLQNPDEPQDAEVCLQIAIMCLILDPARPKFAALVRKFAAICGVDGNLIAETVQTVDEALVKQTEESVKRVEIPAVEEPPADGTVDLIVKPFEVVLEEELPPIDHSEFSVESVEAELESFAGPDRAKWFDGDENTAWRAARLCVAHLMGKLDPDSFAVLG